MNLIKQFSLYIYSKPDKNSTIDIIWMMVSLLEVGYGDNTRISFKAEETNKLFNFDWTTAKKVQEAQEMSRIY